MAKRLARRIVGSEGVALRPAAEVLQIRESSISSLAAHGLLDVDQVAAAMRFRDAWQLVAIASRPHRDFERVDGHARSTRTEAETAARAILKQCRFAAGQYGFELLVKVCGEGFHVRDLYQSRRERDTATDLLRINLSNIACACFRAY